MALTNTWFYTKTIIDWKKLEASTGNKFRVVTSRPYTDKKNKLSNGYTITLMVLEDSADYGIDKKTGLQRDNNQLQNFDVTILSDSKPAPKKGDYISLSDFDSENSFAIGFDLILRFRDFQKLKVG